MNEVGISQRELARKLGVHRNTVVTWIQNQVDPGLKNAYRIAEILNCDPEWLLGEKSNRVTEQRSGYGERRSDYRQPGMRELIKKALVLDEKSRQIIIKTIDLYLNNKEG